MAFACSIIRKAQTDSVAFAIKKRDIVLYVCVCLHRGKNGLPKWNNKEQKKKRTQWTLKAELVQGEWIGQHEKKQQQQPYQSAYAKGYWKSYYVECMRSIWLDLHGRYANLTFVNVIETNKNKCLRENKKKTESERKQNGRSDPLHFLSVSFDLSLFRQLKMALCSFWPLFLFLSLSRFA